MGLLAAAFADVAHVRIAALEARRNALLEVGDVERGRAVAKTERAVVERVRAGLRTAGVDGRTTARGGELEGVRGESSADDVVDRILRQAGRERASGGEIDGVACDQAVAVEREDAGRRYGHREGAERRNDGREERSVGGA